ncbi:hypothetical protein V5799_004161 [Amblyomma americanum]|uniref:Uncharacterized protein n=1 Tax=Amblyomma americanum TaxID=6943 RepID=A0AAQ4D6W1_AMBAM
MRSTRVDSVEKQDGLSPVTVTPDFQKTSSHLHRQAQPFTRHSLNVLREFQSSQTQASPEMLEVLLTLQQAWKRLQEASPLIERVLSLQKIGLPLESALRECPPEETPDPDPGIEEPAQRKPDCIPPDKLNATSTPGLSTSPLGRSDYSFPATALENQECRSTTPQKAAARWSSPSSKLHKSSDSNSLSAVGSEARFVKKEPVQRSTPQPKEPGLNDETPKVVEGAAQVTAATAACSQNVAAALNVRTWKNEAPGSLKVRPPELVEKLLVAVSGSATLHDFPSCKGPVPQKNKSVQYQCGERPDTCGSTCVLLAQPIQYEQYLGMVAAAPWNSAVIVLAQPMQPPTELSPYLSPVEACTDAGMSPQQNTQPSSEEHDEGNVEIPCSSTDILPAETTQPLSCPNTHVHEAEPRSNDTVVAPVPPPQDISGEYLHRPSETPVESRGFVPSQPTGASSHVLRPYMYMYTQCSAEQGGTSGSCGRAPCFFHGRVWFQTPCQEPAMPACHR